MMEAVELTFNKLFEKTNIMADTLRHVDSKQTKVQIEIKDNISFIKEMKERVKLLLEKQNRIAKNYRNVEHVILSASNISRSSSTTSFSTASESTRGRQEYNDHRNADEDKFLRVPSPKILNTNEDVSNDYYESEDYNSKSIGDCQEDDTKDILKADSVSLKENEYEDDKEPDLNDNDKHMNDENVDRYSYDDGTEKEILENEEDHKENADSAGDVENGYGEDDKEPKSNDNFEHDNGHNVDSYDDDDENTKNSNYNDNEILENGYGESASDKELEVHRNTEDHSAYREHIEDELQNDDAYQYNKNKDNDIDNYQKDEEEYDDQDEEERIREMAKLKAEELDDEDYEEELAREKAMREIKKLQEEELDR